MGRVPDLLAALPALTDMERPVQGYYVGLDSGYAARVRQPSGGGQTPPPSAPEVEALVSQDRVSRMRLALGFPGDPPMVVDLRLSAYGAPVQIPEPG